MKDLIPIPKPEDFVKQFEEDEHLAEQEAAGEAKNEDEKKDSDEEPNDMGIIIREKEWYKETNEK